MKPRALPRITWFYRVVRGSRLFPHVGLGSTPNPSRFTAVKPVYCRRGEGRRFRNLRATAALQTYRLTPGRVASDGERLDVNGMMG